MDTPRSKRRKADKITPIDLDKVFSAMAYDLKISQNEQVIKARSLLLAGHHLSFVKMLDEWSSQTYNSIGDLGSRLLQLAALFTKFPFEDKSINREAVALEKFRKSEHKCRRMNQKFRARRLRVEPPHMQFMREWIQSVIGEKPPVKKIMDLCDFGPGSAVGVHGSDTSAFKKLRHLSVTPSCRPVALEALARNHHYASMFDSPQTVAECDDLIDSLKAENFDTRHADKMRDGLLEFEAMREYDNFAREDYERFSPWPICGAEPVRGPVFKTHTVQYNKIVCVPKNAKTDRTIAIEPTLNGFIQKGIDLVLRGKLYRIGIDLSSQALNQALARLGSLSGNYATIDLSAASDSVSIQLVRELLPPEWFVLLDATRSPAYIDPKGQIRRYEKFCSMGNGFCFPLETLIFRAAVEYVMSVTSVHRDRTVAVYGDDIIVPQETALLLLEVLRDLGFKHNEDKTFIVGGFRESCGADYFFGVNVRPIYIKKPLIPGPQCYPLLNELRRRKLTRTWEALFEQIPVRWRLLRPYHREDDSAIDVPMDVFLSSKHAYWNRDTHSWWWKKVVVVPADGATPIGKKDLLMGKLRGDLIHSETFAARFSERTRIQLGC